MIKVNGHSARKYGDTCIYKTFSKITLEKTTNFFFRTWIFMYFKISLGREFYKWFYKETWYTWQAKIGFDRYLKIDFINDPTPS